MLTGKKQARTSFSLLYTVKVQNFQVYCNLEFLSILISSVNGDHFLFHINFDSTEFQEKKRILIQWILLL